MLQATTRTDDLEIRRMTRDEIDKCVHIVTQNYKPREIYEAAREELPTMFAPENALCMPVFYAVVREGRIIAFAGTLAEGHDFNTQAIFWVNVIPEQQRSGIGTKLIEHLLDIFRADASTYLVILSTPDPDFYTRLGFKDVGKFGPPDHNGKRKSHMILVLEK